MGSTSLTSTFLTPDPSFNWFFLLELIVSCILALFFLLYFNRLFANLISYAIRSYTWHYYRAYVDINALQVSLLGGRIFFKGIRYHGVNETIFIHGGFITWRYWTRTVERNDLAGIRRKTGLAHHTSREEACPRDATDDNLGEQGGMGKTTDLPCRITINTYGLEWFIYNRTPAYDSILTGFGYSSKNVDLDGDNSNPPGSRGAAENGNESNAFDFKDTPGHRPTIEPLSQRSTSERSGVASQKTTIRGSELSDPVSNMLQLLPMKLDCQKGAIVIGNEHTRSVLTTTFDTGMGTIDASNSGPLDLYRQIFSFQVKNAVVQMRPNPDFKQNQSATAKDLGAQQEKDHASKKRPQNIFNYQFQRRRVWHSIRDLVPYFQTSVESFHDDGRHANSMPRSQAEFPEVRWTGLSRYLDEDSGDDHEKWNSVEYARFSTIVDSPMLNIAYFWDVPGRVIIQPPSAAQSQSMDSNINYAPSPEWGMDLKIHGGTINYGPWADRERVGLQNVFFPNFYRNAEPTEKLAPGALRQSTAFRLRIEINRELTLRIPTREPSKDWQWKGRADAVGGASRTKKPNEQKTTRAKEGEKGYLGPEIRPFGWLSLSVGADSTINYTMDMVGSSTGFSNGLSIDLRESRLSSSINHGLLWQCPRQQITCDLSNPLSWNGLRPWKFTAENHDLQLFLLRDHIFLLTDLVSDWASGPPSDYYSFVPFIYNLDLNFSDFQLYINVNDRNIISNPSDLEDNRFLVIKGKRLAANAMIPLDKYQPEQNAIDFRVNLEDGGVDYTTPLWDTLHEFLPQKSMATLENLFIDGSYNYFQSTSPELTDTLMLNVDGTSPRLYLFGFLVESFMTIRENYFGEEMHFRTLEEYQELVYADEPPSNPTGTNPNRKSNDMDVLVRVTVDSPRALLPVNIYDHSKCMGLSAASLEANLRFTNYYMDLQFSITPVKIDLETTELDGPSTISSTQLFIDGVSVYGHRLFGLPPLEPTYVCNWDFDVGRIVGECSTEFLACLASSLKSFDFSFDNEENALPMLFPELLFDVTFLRAKVDSIHISVLLDQTAVILSTQPLNVNFNDWANTKFSKRMSLLVPDISIAAVDRQSVSQCNPSAGEKMLSPIGLFQLTIGVKLALRKSDIAESRRLQQEHIRTHDQRTHRAQWLLFDWEETGPASTIPSDDDVFPPTMAIPSMPEPIHDRIGSVDAPSYQGASGPRTTRSAKSFFVQSEASSMKSVRIHTVNSPRAASKSISKSRPFLPTRGSSASVSKANRSRDGPNYGPRVGASSHSTTRDTNPWIMPQFSYYKLHLDTSELPLPFVDEDDTMSEDSSMNQKSVFLTFDDDQTKYINLACNLPLGIRGFCTPEFLLSLATLLDGLEPKHPTRIIDSLQKDVISSIVGYDNAMSKPRISTAVSLYVPSIQLRLVDLSAAPNNNQVEFRDEYSLDIRRLHTEFRRKVQRQKGDLLEGLKQGVTVHAAADYVSISIEGRRADSFHEKAVFNSHMEDMNFWLVTSPNIRSNLQMRTFNTMTSAKSVERLAFLVRRATTMFDSVASSFQQILTSSEKRLQYLLYSLTQSATDIPDPIFLARISYVLRVASTHLRQHDSWKIISRIRKIYESLSAHQKRELEQKCLCENFPLPANAKKAVLSGFDRWRAWDLAHVAKSYVMRRVWPHAAERQTSEPSMFISSTIQTFQFSMDPGPKESDLVIGNLSTVASFAPHAPEGEGGSKQLITLQSYCGSTALRLRWEILDLAEGVIKVMSNITLASSPGHVPIDKVQEKTPIELQIMFGTDFGSITLDCVNVKLALIAKALRGSIVHKALGAKEPEDLAVLFSAEGCSSELQSQSTTLMLSRIADPYVYLSLASEEDDNECRHDWKIAGSCRKLRYDMKEDPVSLAHTADRLIADEVRYIRQLMDSVKVPNPETGQSLASNKPTRDTFHVAMFLEDYRLTFTLLPSLSYLLSGEVARMTVMPTEASKIEIDFDVKKNSHMFVSGESHRFNVLSILEIPPVNGRILANLLPDRKEVEIDITIELIRLEASAVRSLLAVLTGPDVSHLVCDIKQNLDVLQLHLKDVLSLQKVSPKPKPASDSQEILYKSRLTMAGFEIHAIAPGLKGKDYSAEMIFSLGMMRMRLQNGLDRGYAMEHPEFNIDAPQIIFELRKQQKASSQSYGGFSAGVKLQGTSAIRQNGEITRAYHFTSDRFDVELSAETAALVVDIAVYTQERIKTLDLSHEVKRLRRLRHGGHIDTKDGATAAPEIHVNDDSSPETFLNALYSLQFRAIQIAWNMTTVHRKSGRQPENLVFSIQQVELSNKKKNAAKLRIENMQLQMVPFGADREKRSLNSALMPELVFNVAYASKGKEVCLAFQAAGKSLDIRATSEFIIPASMIQDSMSTASEALREGKAVWATKADSPENTNTNKDRSLFGNRRLRSLLVDVDFAGAIVTLQGKLGHDHQTLLAATWKGSRLSDAKYGQYVQGDVATTATLRAPGVALKVQFEDNGTDDPALNAELKVDPSTNTLYPTLVPLVKQMTATVKEIMGNQQGQPRKPSAAAKFQTQKPMQEKPFDAADPTSILGRCKVNVGLLFYKQEFSLSCQPIARVAATARFESVYVTVNTVLSEDHGRFLALSLAFNSLEASVKHVYSNESTASFEVKSMVLSLMNSKHLGRMNGMSAILRVSPMKVAVNAKQVQDSLLFKEIWLPSDNETTSSENVQPGPSETQSYIVQRYQQVASASAFPWTTTIAIEKVEIQLDLGSTLGKAQFAIIDLWVSTSKTSDSEQNMCINFGSVAIESKGRMSGIVELRTLRIHTSIEWPESCEAGHTPLIQATIAFQHLQAKVSFDYQPFLVAQIAMFNFLMYNVRNTSGAQSQRLFSILEGDKLQLFCTSLTASQTLALFQAWQRLIQDVQAAYKASLREVERYLRRKSSVLTERFDVSAKNQAKKDHDKPEKAPISLHTGVVVKIRHVNLGAFPSSFFDNQIFKVEAHDAEARFSVSLEANKIHSALGLTLGQLRVALSGITRPTSAQLDELSVDEISERAAVSRGGTILKVPRLVASMETWQAPGSHQIDYIFRSTFEGKVDVGWNYSRISFIRDMWETHSRALASRLGKPLPPSAVRITSSGEGSGTSPEQQEKITAVVNVPQSRYTYTALEPPIIETPQLRDMGEATPPLEWIGLQRDKLPNVTHQIIIVTLLEIAKEVEDAYGKILGS
ncbi:hypothetical protein CBS147317_2333 [Penicillium roqueforti]|nr:hypothetical protein CBS147372_1684 [Penicillium roqueforti]KAI2731611.1 hypothetical protein CBS147354_720 [Penicillium roqueforti]KAI3166390.1 hypothetical protein CBS147317_2333 [Penicillium roqueforti]KAI3278091.1 hypothetical protein CBS147309_2290 [Penicillium roqueforti]